MPSTADPRTIAGKIVSRHNARCCHACQRPVKGGVFAFGLSGSDARWYPSEQDALEATANRARYLLPIQRTDLTVDETIAWLEAQRDEITALVDHLEEQKMERRAEREQRAASAGYTTRSAPCEDCAKNGVRHLKFRPADECDRCGDNPVPLGITPEDYNRARGYAF